MKNEKIRIRASEDCFFIKDSPLSQLDVPMRQESAAGFMHVDVRCFSKQTNRQGGEIMPEQAKKGDTVQVHYTGRLENGQVFDSSEGGEPLEFAVGSGQVIKGFDEGVEGMSVGDSRQIEIEATDAYGERVENLV